MRRKCRRESISIDFLQTAAKTLFSRSKILKKSTLSAAELEVVPFHNLLAEKLRDFSARDAAVSQDGSFLLNT